MNGGEIAAWVAALAGAVALISQATTAIKKRKKEQSEIEEALDHAPEVRHQLEIGNVGEAVKHLNVILESQARYIKDQDTKLKNCDDEITHLKSINEAREEEAAAWERKYREMQRHHEEYRLASDKRIAAIQAEMEEMKRTFARSLAQLRAGEKVDPEAMDDLENKREGKNP